MTRLSHRLYSLPFKWSLQHIAGVDLPLADALSRLHAPYVCAFSDRHLRWPDLKRENIFLPPEWKKTPNLVLTTSDILQGMHDQIMFIEKSSSNVKNKRLKALVAEIATLYEDLENRSDSLVEQIHAELEEIETTAKSMEKHSDKVHLNPVASVGALTAVSPKVLITPHYLVKQQNANPKFHAIMTQLRSIPRDNLKAKILKKYRLLNDSILVTRKNKKLPFDAHGNMRIVCDSTMTLTILSLLHLMGGHYGINTLARLFAITYKSSDSIQGFAKIVASGCKSCMLHRPVNKRTVPPGRIPFAPFPLHTFHMDHMCFKKEQYWKGKKIEAALNITDLYSSLLISFLVPDQTHQTTIKCLKELFSTMPAPVKMVSDNGPALCSNKDVFAFLKSKGVKAISTITPYNSKGNKTERIHKTMRETLALVQETFQRKSQFDMYYTVIEMLNNRPLSLVLYPHIKKALGGTNETVTPFSLHYGFKPPIHPTVQMEDKLLPEDREAYQKRWRGIISEHDKILQQELDEQNKNFKPNDEIQKGSLVLLVNKTAHKENLKYYRNLYEVVSIQKAKYYCSPLFGGSPLIGVSGNLLKPYRYTELFELLPPEVRRLMGESLSPDELKARKTTDPKAVPADFQNWGLLKIPEQMKLRNRLTPASLVSVPAVSLSHTNTISHLSSDESGYDSESGISIDRETQLSSVILPPQLPPIKGPEFKVTKRTILDESKVSDPGSKLTEGAPQLLAADEGVKEVKTTAVRLPPKLPRVVPLIRKPLPKTPPVPVIPPVARKTTWERMMEELEQNRIRRREQQRLRSRTPRPSPPSSVSSGRPPVVLERSVYATPLATPAVTRSKTALLQKTKVNETTFTTPDTTLNISFLPGIRNATPGRPVILRPPVPDVVQEPVLPVPVQAPVPAPVLAAPALPVIQLPVIVPALAPAQAPQQPVQPPPLNQPAPVQPIQRPQSPAPVAAVAPPVPIPPHPLTTRTGRTIRLPKRFFDFETDIETDEDGVRLIPANIPVPAPAAAMPQLQPVFDPNARPADDKVKTPDYFVFGNPDTMLAKTPESSDSVSPDRPLSPDVLVIERDDDNRNQPKSILRLPGFKAENPRSIRIQKRQSDTSSEQSLPDLFRTAVAPDKTSETIYETPNATARRPNLTIDIPKVRPGTDISPDISPILKRAPRPDMTSPVIQRPPRTPRTKELSAFFGNLLRPKSAFYRGPGPDLTKVHNSTEQVAPVPYVTRSGRQVNPPTIFGQVQQPQPALPLAVPQPPANANISVDDDDLTRPNTPDLVMPTSPPLKPDDDALSQHSVTLPYRPVGRPNLDTSAANPFLNFPQAPFYSLPPSPVKQQARQNQPRMTDAQTSSNTLSFLDTSGHGPVQGGSPLRLPTLVRPGISKTPQYAPSNVDPPVMRSRSTGYPSGYQANFLREVREKLDSIKKGTASPQKQPILPDQADNLQGPDIHNITPVPLAVVPEPRQPSPVQPVLNVQPQAQPQDFEAQGAKPKTNPKRKTKPKTDQSEPPRRSTRERRQPDYYGF
jgi:hypothetical protein